MTTNKSKQESMSKNLNETASSPESNPSNEDSDALYSPESSFLQIDSIAQRIANLTEDLQQSDSRSDWDSANEKIIAFESELTRLQIEVQKQAQLKNQSQVGNELLGAIGEQLESLTEELRNTASQNNQYYEGNLGCIHAVLKELKADIETFTQQTNTGDTATALQNLTQQVAATSALTPSVEELIQNVQKIGLDTSTQLTSETLKQHFDSLAAHLPTRNEFENLAAKIESTTDLLKIEAFPENSTDTAQIDELSEQIHALAEWLATTIGKPEEKPDHTDAIQALAEKMDSLEQSIGVQKLDSQNEQRLREMDDRLSQLTGHWTQFEASIKETLAAPKDEGKTESIVDEMTKKLDALATQMENQIASASHPEIEFQAQFEQLSTELAETKSMVNQLTDCIGQLLRADRNQTFSPPEPTGPSPSLPTNEAELTPEADEPPPTETKIPLGSPSWEQQKQALLRDHGVKAPIANKTEPAPSVYEPEQESPVNEPEVPVASSSEAQPSTHEEAPTPELADLKSELEEKLRRAEIEISIERAKLHQERRELETIQNEIHRQQVKIDSQGEPLPNPKDGESNEQSGRRWSRFLGN